METETEVINEALAGQTGQQNEVINEALAGQTGQQNTLILMGITGDLATKKTVPSLWTLYRDDSLPTNFNIVGTGRSPRTIAKLRQSIDPYVGLKNDDEKKKYEKFWKIISYIDGSFNNESGFKKLKPILDNIEKNFTVANRLYYLALPPSVYESTSKAIHDYGMRAKNTGWTRLIIEKPFGHDLESSNKLSSSLAKLFTEDQIYRIDHFLGKETVQNLMVLRFGNRFFGPIWNRENIAGVLVLFKEPFGTAGRGQYFDENGIIRDMMQNHLLQILSLVAMEKPISSSAKDIRDAKVKLLKSMKDVKSDDLVIGQYIGNPHGEGEAKLGYLDDKDVKKDSLTPTFALTAHHIDNDRWKDVPFFILAGKALNESRIEVRIQFKNVAGNVFGEHLKNNMLILRIQPNEAIFQKFMIKKPGMEFSLEETELDLTYATKYKNAVLPDAYERLILDVFASRQSNYVRTDELQEAWRIFTPIIHQIEKEKRVPVKYMFGSSGFKEADALFAKYGLQNLV